MFKKQFLGIVAASILGGAVAIGGFKMFSEDKEPNKKFITIESEQKYNLTGYEDIKVDVPGGLDFRKAAKATTPGVVHIKTYAEVKEVQRSPFQDEMFREFFGDRFQQAPQQRPDGPQPAASGSGVILTPSGYIATNNHVVKDADKVEVVLHDKRRYEAEVVGTDPTTDLALLKIDEVDLPFIPYGESDKVEIGDWVLAVGNPFNLNSTVTAGIVSAKARNIHILQDRDNLAVESFIQTDAAVNPGNSGGALVSLEGKLIGINTAIATPTGTYAGYSFAVPSSLVKKVIQDLKDHGQVQRALLGVNIQDVTAELADEKELKALNGVYIAGVRPDGAAADAGIKEGDVILEVDGRKVNSSSQLQEAVALHRPGEEIEITLKRDGKELKKKAQLRNKMGTIDIVEKSDRMVTNVLGAKMRSLTDEEKKQFNLKSGVKVLSLSNGKLRSAGMQEGMIITRIDKVPVRFPDEVDQMLKNKEDGALIEGIDKNGEKAYIGFGW